MRFLQSLFMTEIYKTYAEDVNHPYWVQDFGSAGLELNSDTYEFMKKGAVKKVPERRNGISI